MRSARLLRSLPSRYRRKTRALFCVLHLCKGVRLRIFCCQFSDERTARSIIDLPRISSVVRVRDSEQLDRLVLLRFQNESADPF